MTPDFTFIWPLSCLKNGVHLSGTPGRRARNVGHPVESKRVYSKVPVTEECAACAEVLTPAPQGFLGHLIAREFSQEECRDEEAG